MNDPVNAVGERIAKVSEIINRRVAEIKNEILGLTGDDNDVPPAGQVLDELVANMNGYSTQRPLDDWLGGDKWLKHEWEAGPEPYDDIPF